MRVHIQSCFEFALCQEGKIKTMVNKTYFAACQYVEICLFRIGLDLYEGVVRDNKKAGVLEPAISKIKSLKFATEAAITILRIDDLIKLAPEQKQGNSYSDAVARGEL